jgi:hypothetical protein
MDSDEKVIKLRDTASIRRALNQVNMDSIRSGPGDAPPSNTEFQNTPPSMQRGNRAHTDGGSEAGTDTATATATSYDGNSQTTGPESGDDNSESGSEESGRTGNTQTTAYTTDDHERLFGDLREAGAGLVKSLESYAKSSDGRTITDCLASIADSLASLVTEHNATADQRGSAFPDPRAMSHQLRAEPDRPLQRSRRIPQDRAPTNTAHSATDSDANSDSGDSGSTSSNAS